MCEAPQSWETPAVCRDAGPVHCALAWPGAQAPALTRASLLQPEVLHMIYLRALQIVYGTRLEHFYMVGSPPFPVASQQVFRTKSKAYVKLTSLTEESEAWWWSIFSKTSSSARPKWPLIDVRQSRTDLQACLQRLRGTSQVLSRHCPHEGPQA